MSVSTPPVVFDPLLVRGGIMQPEARSAAKSLIVANSMFGLEAHGNWADSKAQPNLALGGVQDETKFDAFGLFTSPAYA
ncbi:hypothetical protein [Bradyrhizobium sp. BR 1432]|uniref:hypothetical protein n=1 Tax=Bradyrhizobium sp. BR 1432 TaxID=3447966 RepID=UPI003EE51547